MNHDTADRDEGIELRYFWPLAGFALVATFLWIGLSLNPTKLPSALINQTAPAFSLPVLGSESEQFQPKQLLGQRWLLNVWASWCVACRIEHPLLNQLASTTAIPLVGLNYKDAEQNAQRWLAERGDPYSIIAADVSGDVGIDWGVYGVPETFVINEYGQVIYKHTGPLDASTIENEVLPLFYPNRNLNQSSNPTL